jgi:hypothetical protein
MKTNALHSKLLAGIALAFGTGLAIPAALAGPGPQFWNRPAAKTEPSATVAPAPHSASVSACTDSRLVTITETKSILPNGRGPTRTVEVGKKLLCTSCDTPLVVMKPSGSNGRGAMAPVEVRGTHDCTKNGCVPAQTVASVR